MATTKLSSLIGSSTKLNTFTAQLTSGATTTPTFPNPQYYIRIGDVVTVVADFLMTPAITVNGTALEITCTGLPAVIRATQLGATEMARANFTTTSAQHWEFTTGGVLKLMQIAGAAGNNTAVPTQSSGSYTPNFGYLTFSYITNTP